MKPGIERPAARMSCAATSACLLVGLLGFIGSAMAQRDPAAAEADLLASLPPPPVPGSPADRADLETVFQVQADRMPAQVARARRAADHSPFAMGALVFGPWFDADHLPHTAAVFLQVNRETLPLIKAAKARWARPRPFLRDPRLQPCVKAPSDGSYPSAHAASSAIWAAVLAAAFPEYENEFAAQVREIMWCRVIGGVHYPSDTQAGREFGAQWAQRFLTSPANRQMIEDIRSEVLAKHDETTRLAPLTFTSRLLAALGRPPADCRYSSEVDR